MVQKFALLAIILTQLTCLSSATADEQTSLRAPIAYILTVFQILTFRDYMICNYSRPSSSSIASL